MITPKLEARQTGEFYQQALKLARIYCPEWDPAKDDPGLVLLKLFTRLTEILTGQCNRIPEKHLLAFYDFIGIDCLSAAEAKVPLTFKLSEGSREAMTPERTKVASAVNPDIVFETVEALTPVCFNIKAAYSCNPWQDKYTDHSSLAHGEAGGFRIFGGDAREMPITHTLYLADEVFLSKKPLDIGLQFIMENEHPKTLTSADYLPSCYDGSGKLLETSGVFPGILLNQVIIPDTEIDNMRSYWLAFRSRPGFLQNNSFPAVSEIRCSVSADGIAPDTVFNNDALVELKKGFYPFGTMPKPGDALYIGSEDGFSKIGAMVNIDFQLSGGLASPDLKLAWEYWNGESWTKLDLAADADSTKQLSQPGKISFILPVIPPLEMGGITNRWVRVIIITGGYGKGGDYRVKQLEEVLKTPISQDDQKKLADIKTWLIQKNIAFGIEYQQPTYQPPYIQRLAIGYRINKSVDRIKVLNDYQFQDIRVKGEPVAPFTPFLQGAEELPSFYLGFEESLGNKPVNLYFSLKAGQLEQAPLYLQKSDYTGNFDLSDKSPGFVWCYFSEKGWLNLTVNDETMGLSRNGLIKLVIPPKISKKSLFGRELYWFRAALKDGAWFEPPELAGIYPNTVWAENAALIHDEPLGSSNGEAGQTFTFANRPILSGQIIEVKEPGIPSEEELAVLKGEEGFDAVRVERNDAGDPVEVWVRWHEVKNFAYSHSLSKHYIIDRASGKVSFGDGKRGMIPPALPNNILARVYRSGGGRNGNQSAQSITGLKTTIPNIDSVTNYSPAVGGRDPELMEAVIKRAPHTLKICDRAVTAGDFEWLAREASPDVARARCFREFGGDIRVIIAAGSEKGFLAPDTALLNLVKTHLQKKSLVTLKGQIEVVGPSFQKIDIKVAVAPLNLSESIIITDRIQKKLEAYFNPAQGGVEDSGWEFGQDIFLSEVAALIEDVDGVKYVTDIELLKRGPDGRVEERALIDPVTPGNTCIRMAENELPYPGVMTISIGGEN